MTFEQRFNEDEQVMPLYSMENQIQQKLMNIKNGH